MTTAAKRKIKSRQDSLRLTVTKRDIHNSTSCDKLLRLTSATRSGGVTGTVSYGYDEAGSFRYKSDQSTVTTTAPHAYRYGTGNLAGVADAGPHAVTQVSLSAAYGGGTRSLGYDDAGNLISGSNARNRGQSTVSGAGISVRPHDRDDSRGGILITPVPAALKPAAELDLAAIASRRGRKTAL